MFGKNRKQRLELFKQVRSATHNTRTARLSWNVQESQEANDRTVTASTAGFEAVKMVRELLSQYIWPTAPKLSYTGMRRTSVRLDQKEVDAGVITVSGELRSPLGVEVAFDVPVEIRAGRLLEPSIMVFGGHPRVISQSTIDTVIRDNNTYMDTPVRPIYGAPLDKNEAAARKPFHQERRSPGMFAVAGKQAALRDFIRTKGMKGTAQLQDAAGVEDWEKDQLSGAGGNPLYQPNKKKHAPIELTQPHVTDPMQHSVVEPTDLTQAPIGLPPSPGTATMPETGHGECQVCGQAILDEQFAPYWCGRECMQYEMSRTQKIKNQKSNPGSKPSPKSRSSSKDDDDDSEARAQEEQERDEQEPSLDDTWQGEQESMERESSKSKGASKTAHMNAEEKKVVRYSPSKNPEPVPHNPAMGDDVKDDQPNVEDDLERKQQFMPGQKVTLKKKLSAPTRGGGRVIFNSGLSGKVIRDQAGDGYAVYVKFEDGRHALVPGQYL